jgi:tetratricopeptide (TPR) repeat protein
VDLISPGTAIKAAELGRRELRKLRRKAEVRNLVNATATRLMADHRVSAPARKAVRTEVKGFVADPEVGGCLKELLSGNRSVLAQLERRVTQVLDVPNGVDARLVVAAFMDVVQQELVGAKRDERAALDLLFRESTAAHDRTTTQLDDVLEQGLQHAEALAESQQSITALGTQLASRSGASAYAWLTRSSPLGPRAPEMLRTLAEADKPLADEVAERLAEGGGVALAGWAQLNRARMAARPAELIGRLLMSERQYDEAEACFLRAAELDASERLRQLVRASHAAHNADRPERAVELLAQARALDESHPAVVIAAMRQTPPAPETVIERLSAVTPETDADRLSRAISLAQAYLLHLRFDEADAALAVAEAADAAELAVREIRAIWQLLRQECEVQEGSEPDLGELGRARATFLSIREELLRYQHFDEAGHMLARAIETHIAAKETATAATLMDSARPEERGGQAALAIARHGVVCDRGELTLEIVQAAPPCETRQLIEAEVGTRSEDEQLRAEGLRDLEQLLFSSDEQVRLQAALARALACIDHRDPAPWWPRAEEILAEQNPVMATVLRARAHIARGEFDRAEALLRPHAEDPETLDALVDAAGVRRDFPLALERSEALLRLRDTPGNRLQQGKLLRLNGRLPDALAVLSEVARTTKCLLPSERREAYREALMCAQTLERFEDMMGLADEAIALASEHGELHWARAYARHRLGRHDQALAGLDQAGIEPTSMRDAELLSRILYRAGDRATVVGRLLSLSERFGRPETLEIMVIVASAHAEVPVALVEPVRETLRSFVERFPQSAYLIQMKIPEDAQELREWLEQMVPDPRQDLDAAEAVTRGEQPVAALAAATSKALSEVWPCLVALPVAFGDPTLEELEFQDAQGAMTTAAVLDPSALAMLAMLGTEVEQAVRNALPGSIIAQATLQDADRAVDPASDPRASTAVLTRDATGQPRILSTDCADAVRRAALQEQHSRLAKSLSVEPDAVPGSDDELERALLGEHEIEPTTRTLVATIAVARRLHMPALSDDRRVRVYLRSAGVPTFATLTLLRALVERGDLPEAAYQQARDGLLRAGALGLRPTATELAALARETGWQPSPALYRLLSDPAWWGGDVLSATAQALMFLSICAQGAPDEFAEWVARVLDSAQQALPEAPSQQHVLLLLAVAWGWTSAPLPFDRSLLHRLIDAVRRRPASDYCGELENPVLAALDLLISALIRRRDQNLSLLVLKAISALRLTDQIAALRFLGVPTDTKRRSPRY